MTISSFYVLNHNVILSVRCRPASCSWRHPVSLSVPCGREKIILRCKYNERMKRTDKVIIIIMLLLNIGLSVWVVTNDYRN